MYKKSNSKEWKFDFIDEGVTEYFDISKEFPNCKLPLVVVFSEGRAIFDVDITITECGKFNLLFTKPFKEVAVICGAN